MVVKVEPGGPADQAGVLLGDILVAVGDTPLEDVEDLRSFSDSGVIGKPVKLRIIRAGTPRELEITIGERPARFT
jgi:S1-C subfamily serine protease